MAIVETRFGAERKFAGSRYEHWKDTKRTLPAAFLVWNGLENVYVSDKITLPFAWCKDDIEEYDMKTGFYKSLRSGRIVVGVRKVSRDEDACLTVAPPKACPFDFLEDAGRIDVFERLSNEDHWVKVNWVRDEKL